MAFSVSKLAQFCNAYGQQHWQTLKHVLKYLQGTKNIGLLIDTDDKTIKLVGVSDADYATCKRTRKSMSGYIFFIGSTPVIWKTKQQPVVAQSSTEAELISLAEACKQAVYLKGLFEELGFPQDDPIPIHCDNTSTVKIAHNNTLHDHSKHIEIRFLLMRDLIKRKILAILHIISKLQRADILTKSLSVGLHRHHCTLLNLVENEEVDSPSMPTQTALSLFAGVIMCKGGEHMNTQTVTARESNERPNLPCETTEAKLIAPKPAAAIIVRKNATTVNTTHSTSSAARKTINSWKTVILALFMLLLSNLPSGGTFQTITKLPVFWRQSDIPIVSGYIQYDMQIVLLNPCTLLTTANIPDDLLAHAQQQCQSSYENDFIRSLSKVCPRRTHTDHNIEKRVVPLLIIGGVALLIVAVAGSGIAVAAIVKANNNENRIGDLEERYSAIVTNIEILEKRYSEMSEVMQDVMEKFNSPVLYLNDLSNFFSDFRHQSISQAYEIASVVMRIGMGASILHETTWEWNQGRVNMAYLNVSLPCGNQCAFEHARAERCSYGDARNELWMSIDVPVLNEEFVLLEAEPFTLMKQTNDEICRVDYQGPPQAIVGKDTDCIHPLINPRPVNTEILLYPMDRCQQEDVHLKRTQPFTVTSCEPASTNDHLKFIQLKREGNQLFVYCPMSNITINNKVRPCPNQVFSLPLNTQFKLNNIRYNVSQVKIRLKETFAPFNTMRTNWYLFDHENLTSLLLPDNDLTKLKEEPVFVKMQPIHRESHYIFWTFIAVIVFGSLIVISLIIRMIQKKKTLGPIVVRAVPSNEGQHSPDQRLLAPETS